LPVSINSGLNLWWDSLELVSACDSYGSGSFVNMYKIMFNNSYVNSNNTPPFAQCRVLVPPNCDDYFLA